MKFVSFAYWFAMAFLAGYSFRSDFPTKYDKEGKHHDYVMACFDGQIEMVNAIYNKQDARDCREMAKENVK